MILVTGGTGFVGRHLVRKLATDGYPTQALSRQNRRTVFPKEIEVVTGDLAEPGSLVDIVRGVDVVVHLAAVLPASRVHQSEFHLVNVAGSAALAQAARKAGARRFIFVSSVGVYGEGATRRPHLESDTPHPITPYQRSKLEGETAVRDTLSGATTDWVILRPTDIFGPDATGTIAAFERVRRRRLWVHGPCHAFMQPVYVEDVVDAILRSLSRDDVSGQVLNIGGPTPLDNEEWIRLLGATLGRHPPQIRLPEVIGTAARWTEGFMSRMGTTPALIARLGRQVADRTVNIEKACRLLRFEPVALGWALDQTVAGMRDMGLLVGQAVRPAAKAKK